MEFTSGLHILQRNTAAKKQRWQGGADPRREGVVKGD
jgi:gamma-glutamyltranspeptidase